jgi:hypothetical protein
MKRIPKIKEQPGSGKRAMIVAGLIALNDCKSES